MAESLTVITSKGKIFARKRVSSLCMTTRRTVLDRDFKLCTDRRTKISGWDQTRGEYTRGRGANLAIAQVSSGLIPRAQAGL